jgi:hypothetical protein
LSFSLHSLNEIERNFQTGFILDESDEEKSKPEQVPSIANFFYMLKNNDKNKSKYELLVNSIIDLLPDIEYINPIEIDLKKIAGKSKNHSIIPFELPEKVYDLRVKISTNNQETSIKNISLGSKRIFYVLATTILADMTGCNLLIYEELENSIHPSLLQKLLIILTNLTGCRILITSHSPHLIKYLDLNNIYIGIPNVNGIADFKRIRKTKQSKLIQYSKDAETNIGDFVFDMLIEGFNDNSFWNDFI